MNTKPHHMKNFFAALKRMIFSPKTLPSLKAFRLAFRKDKGAFISGAKENNSCAKGGADVGREISGSTLLRLYHSLPESLLLSAVVLSFQYSSYTLNPSPVGLVLLNLWSVLTLVGIVHWILKYRYSKI